MPVDLIVFTADRRIHGAIPLADDRVSDMLNSVPRIVIRAAVIEDLVSGGPPQTTDLTLAVPSIVAVLVAGRRGIDARRRRTEVHRLASSNPTVVLAGRDILVPLTDATITYDKVDEPTAEKFEAILVNRVHATWIDLDEAAGGDDGELVGERRKVYHAAMVKDFTRAT